MYGTIIVLSRLACSRDQTGFLSRPTERTKPAARTYLYTVFPTTGNQDKVEEEEEEEEVVALHGLPDNP